MQCIQLKRYLAAEFIKKKIIEVQSKFYRR